MVAKFTKLIVDKKEPHARDLGIVQERAEPILNSYSNSMLSDFVSINEVALGTTTVLVPHTLNRKYRGWYLVDLDANAVVYRDSTSTADTSKWLALKASAATTVNLVIF